MVVLVARPSLAIRIFRRSKKLSTALLIALCDVAGGQTPAQPQPTYTITDLGTFLGPLPGASYAYALNASGDVAGAAYTSTGELHAVLFKKGTVEDLGILPGADASIASGLNGYDEVTGYLKFLAPGTQSGTLTHAFLYSASQMKDLGTLPGDDVSLGAAINDSGQITGTSTTEFLVGGPLPPNHGFLYSAGTMTNLAASDPNILGSSGLGINSAGQVTGWANLGAGYPGHAAAVFSNGSGTLLNLHLSPGIPSQGNAITDSGELTGLLYHEDETIRAFLYTNKPGTQIAPLSGDQYSFGNSINVSAQIVGVSLGIVGQHHAFLYTPGQGSINLNSLLRKGSGWTITDATAINDKGQITGWGINPMGFRRAYLLSPVLLPLSELDVSVDQVDIRKPAFAATGRFTLGAMSNGIHPVTETVVLELGGYHISIPPSSFVETYGIYHYQGTIGNVAMEAQIWPAAPKSFSFAIVGEGATGLPSDCSLSLVLTIGDDTGRKQIGTDEGRVSRSSGSRDRRRYTAPVIRHSAPDDHCFHSPNDHGACRWLAKSGNRWETSPADLFSLYCFRIR